MPLYHSDAVVTQVVKTVILKLMGCILSFRMYADVFHRAACWDNYLVSVLINETEFGKLY